MITFHSTHRKYVFNLFIDVFDVVRDCKDHVFLLDFSPFGEKWTESLAFEWVDFENANEKVKWFSCTYIFSISESDLCQYVTEC